MLEIRNFSKSYSKGKNVVDVSPDTSYLDFLKFVDALPDWDVRCRKDSAHDFATAMRAIKDSYEIECTKEEIAEREDFYHKFGRQAVNDFDDPITQKALCEVYGMMKEYSVNNILFTIFYILCLCVNNYHFF